MAQAIIFVVSYQKISNENITQVPTKEYLPIIDNKKRAYEHPITPVRTATWMLSYAVSCY